MNIFEKILFFIGKYISLFVIVISATTIQFKLYFFFGFEETVRLTFVYLLPICIFIQGIILRLYSEKILRYCILTLFVYICIYCFVMGISCFHYVPEFVLLYFIAFLTIGLYRYVRGNNTEEDIEYFKDNSNDKNDDLWLD